MGSRFLPSEVVLIVPPLVGTMGAAEREHAAAIIVRACAQLADVWQPLSPRDIGLVLQADELAQREPFASLVRNPFFRPNVRDLVEAGFAEFDAEERVSLTAKGLDALLPWVRRSEVANG